jgi:hypothetical protein
LVAMANININAYSMSTAIQCIITCCCIAIN